jgi:hypothetical protein
MIDESDLRHLRRCVDLATEALDAGDEPFGSVLVGSDGTVLAEDRNRVAGGDRTRHPEFAMARWAASNLTLEQRGAATVYTSGEHYTRRGEIATRPGRSSAVVARFTGVGFRPRTAPARVSAGQGQFDWVVAGPGFEPG